MFVSNQARHQISVLGLLLDQSYAAFAAIFINSAVYVALSWGLVDSRYLLIWMSGVYALTVLRIYWQHKWLSEMKKISLGRAETIVGRLQIYIGCSALLWSCIGGVFVVPQDPLHLSLTTFLIAGMTAGAVGAFAIRLPSLILYLVVMILPFVVRMLLEPDPAFRIMAAVATLYLALMILVGRNVNRQASKTVELGLENQDLVHRLSDASHEIRTPVAAIVGFAEILKSDPEVPPRLREYTNVILRNSEYMRRLVDNVLMLSKAKLGPLENSEECVSLKDQVQVALDIVAKRAKDKGLSLCVEYDPRIEDFYWIRTLSLQQILINLLVNAVKFTQIGEIKVKVRVESKRLFVKVIDTGIGINPDKAEMVFQPFWRESRMEVKKQEGSGLGLALSRSLADRMGGHLRLVRSEVGKGSEFELCLPARTLEPGQQPLSKGALPRHRLQGKRLVLVDDSEDIRDLYVFRLKAEGAEVVAFPNGEAAVDFVCQHKSDWDLVLMDINMPVMDGHLATLELRKRLYTNPIIALSAYGSPTERDKCMKSGFTDHISKSAGVDNVIDLIGSQFSALASQESELIRGIRDRRAEL